MLRRYSRGIAAVVLGIFSWTSGGVFSVAHAAQDAIKKSKAQAQQQDKGEGAEERLSQLTEELREALAGPNVGHESKKKRLLTGKGELFKLDVEIRKQFAETEKKLKDAKLPAEILERHYKFVKHYDDNLAELKGNIERVEKAKDKKQAEMEMGRTLAHLEKVKAPSRHQPLDPNNLPFRQPKVQKREPRMKKEEFERDLKKDKNAWRSEKRIMVASTGSLAGLLPSEDLAETIEVQFTPEIKAKALELGNNPVKIYEWVRNNIEFVPTWGSIQGAQMTLFTKQGNAIDTSSLLIALLRASGVHARYVTGTVELPIEKIMNWTGGFSDSQTALDFMASGGVPVKAGMSGGRISKAFFEHVWVEAYIDYIPSRGAKHVQGKEDTWIKLDPSYKQYAYAQGVDIKSAVPFDDQALLMQIQSTTTINEAEGYITGINSTLIQQTMEDYQARVQRFIQQNNPAAAIGEIFGKKEVVKQAYPYLLGTLPYRGVIRGVTYSELPDILRHKITFTVRKNHLDEVPIVLTRSLPEVAGKKITLSYVPATPQDEAVISSYLPQPHADRTPIQSSEFPASLPAYLINVKPELRFDEQLVASGAAIGLGTTESFDMTFYDPVTGESIIQNTIDAGTYQAIALNLSRISQDEMLVSKTKLETTKAQLETEDFSGLSAGEMLGDLLYCVALTYLAEVGVAKSIAERNMGVRAVTLPSETIFASTVNTSYVWGIPRTISRGGLVMDADRILSFVRALDGDLKRAKQYVLLSGMQSSALEHAVPEQFVSTTDTVVEGISAVKALKLANDEGIPLYSVTQTNIANVLPQLQLKEQDKQDIKDLVGAGKEVIISKTNITYRGWTGCGYIALDPETGAGGYMISGGLSGSFTEPGNVWGMLDSIGILTGMKFSGMSQLVTEHTKVMDGVAKKTGVVISLVQWLQDLNSINGKPSQDPMQWFSAYLAISSCMILGIALALAIPAGIPAMAAIGLSIVATALVNMLKFYLLEYIYSTRRRNLNNSYEV